MALSGENETPKLDLEALAGLRVPGNFHLSPDGKSVAYTVKPWIREGEHARSAIWVARIDQEHSSRQLTSGLFNDQQPQWSPDGKCIAFTSDRAKAGECSAIYLISLTGGEAYPITPSDNAQQISAFTWSPSATFIAYLSADEMPHEKVQRIRDKDDAKVWGEDWEYARLRSVHVGTRRIIPIVSGDRHVHAFAWSPDSQELAYVEQQTPDMNSPGLSGAQIASNSLVTGMVTQIIPNFPGPIEQLAWGQDNIIYFTAGVMPGHASTARALYEISVSDQTYKRAFFGIDNCCEMLQNSRSCVAVRVESGLYDEIYAVQHGKAKRLYRTMHAIATFDVWLSGDEADIVVAFSQGDGSHPEEVFSVTRSTAPKQLSDHNSAIAALRISEAQPIYAAAPDGYQIDGVLYLPSNYESLNKPLPTVLLVHGGPYSRVTIGFSVCGYLEVPLLVSAGYAVLCPNYRGSSGRGQDHATYARGGMGTVDYTDSIAILREGIERGFVHPSRVAIGGWSQGGFLSYLAVTRNDFQFRGAVCGAGVVDWDSMTMASDAFWFEADYAGGAPWEVDADDGQTSARRGSPLWHMQHVRTPVLILHGEEDVRVPLFQAVAFYRACLHHKVPVKMITYLREGHRFKERKHVIDLWSRMRQFYDVHLA